LDSLAATAAKGRECLKSKSMRRRFNDVKRRLQEESYQFT